MEKEKGKELLRTLALQPQSSNTATRSSVSFRSPLADNIDVLIEGFTEKICKATNQTREELQRELDRLELEEENQPESTSLNKSF
jgi:hypothetical protein